MSVERKTDKNKTYNHLNPLLLANPRQTCLIHTSLNYRRYYLSCHECVGHGLLLLCNKALVQKVIVLRLMAYEARGHINN